MATMKKPAKKYAVGGTVTTDTTKKPTTARPTYKNLPMARSFANKTFGNPENTAATSKDSSFYKLGFAKGVKGKTPAVDEDEYEKMGRWEGQNAKKNVKKNGGPIKKAKTGGKFPDLNKDGKITKADVLIGKGVIKGKKTATKKAQGGTKLGKALPPPATMKSGGKIKTCKGGC